MTAHTILPMPSQGRRPDQRHQLRIQASSSTLPVYLLVIASALLAGAALPNEIFVYGLWPLGFVALAPLYEAFRRSPKRGTALAAGALYGALQHAITSYWLFFYKDFAFWTIGASSAGYALVYMLPALYLHFAARLKGWQSPILFALVWAVFEYGKSNGFLGYPWGLIPYALTSVPILLQIVDVTGVYGLSFLLALGSALLARLLAPPDPMLYAVPTHRVSAPTGLVSFRSNERKRAVAAWAAFLALCWALVLGYGLIRLARLPQPSAFFDALLVQQNVDPWLEGEQPVLESNLRLMRSALQDRRDEEVPDLVVFSETSLRRSFPENTLFYEIEPAFSPLLPTVREYGTHLLTGAPHVIDWKDFQIMNAAILIDPQGKLVDVYGKSHPVPFTEAIPFMEFAWFRAFMKNVVGLAGGWTPGGRMTRFQIPLRSGDRLAFGVPICFEDAFAGLCGGFVRDGADVLINITNDSWSRTVSAEVQHWAAARFRAIETRRPLLRSTNGGVTCVVGIDGTNLTELPLFKEGSLAVKVPLYRGAPLTVYTAFGDWFVVVCALLSIVVIVVRMREFDAQRRTV